MKTMITQGIASGKATIECAEGKEIRVTGFCLLNVTSGGDGDIIVVSYTRSGRYVAILTSEPMTVATATVSGMIGAPTTRAMLDKIDVATGLATYKPVVETCMALPDVWFPYTLLITFAADGGAVSDLDATVTYEERDVYKGLTPGAKMLRSRRHAA